MPQATVAAAHDFDEVALLGRGGKAVSGLPESPLRLLAPAGFQALGQVIDFLLEGLDFRDEIFPIGHGKRMLEERDPFFEVLSLRLALGTRAGAPQPP